MSRLLAYAPAPSLRRLAALFIVLIAVLAVSWSGTDRAGAQDDYEPDPQVIADIWGYAAETDNGYDHVLRWVRVLQTFEALQGMTAAEAREMADRYTAARWDPVVAELRKLEDGQDEPVQQVTTDVRGYARETHNGFDHVLRWMRVLHTFGALDDMTAAEAQGYADRGWGRWDPVAAELAKMEASVSAAEPNRAPVVNEQAWRYNDFVGKGNAPRGILVSKIFTGILSDPDGDELTYTASVSDDQRGLVDELGVSLELTNDKLDFLFIRVDGDDDWKAVSPALPDPLTIPVTLTATDPDGLSASVTGEFLTDWESHPALVSAEAGPDSVTLTFDQDVSADPAPASDQFTVNVTNQDDSTGTIAVSGVSIDGKVLTLGLASELAEGQTVTVDYAHDDDAPLTRAAGGGDSAPGFTGQAVDVSIPNPCPDGTPRIIFSIRLENTFTVSWRSMPAAPAGCELTGFIVELQGDDGSEARSQMLGPAVSDTTIEVPSAAEYLVTVRAIFAESASNGPATGRAAFGGTDSQGLATGRWRFAAGDDPPRTAFVGNVPANCNLALTLKYTANGVHGTWTSAASSCEASVRVQLKKPARATWDSSHWTSMAQAFLYHTLDPIKYEFRIQTRDDNGAVHTSATKSIMVRVDPAIPPQEGRVENVHLEPRNDNSMSVYWVAPASVPTGKTIEGFYIEFWEDGKKGTTLQRVKRTTIENGVTTTVDMLFPASSRDSHPQIWTIGTGDNAVKSQGLVGVVGLTEDVAYRAQVLTKFTDSTLAYSAPSSPKVSMFELLKVWFIGDTPNYNASQGRVYMMVEATKQNASAKCFINGGSINCPPRTLVSLPVSSGDTIHVSAQADFGTEISRNDEVITLNNAHPAHVGAQTPDYVRVSGGNGKILVSWSPAPMHASATTPAQLARIDAYVIESQHSNDDGASWSSWSVAEVVDFSACSQSHCEYLLDDLEHQMYRTAVRLRTLHAELLAGRTELNVADASGISVNDIIQIGSEKMLVTGKVENTLTVTRGHSSTTAAKHQSPAVVNLVNSDNTLTATTTLGKSYFLGMSYYNPTILTPAEVTRPSGPVSNAVVHYPGAGKLTIEWDKPEDNGGSDVYGYILRYRPAGSAGPWTEVSLYPRDILRHCPGTSACSNPRSVTLSGLTSGTRYAVSISALNVNGPGVFGSVNGRPAPD